MVYAKIVIRFDSWLVLKKEQYEVLKIKDMQQHDIILLLAPELSQVQFWWRHYTMPGRAIAKMGMAI
jgi:hypothetical protein